MTSDSFSRPAQKPRPLIDLLVSIVTPSVILMKFSGEADLGTARALLLALAFPVGWGAVRVAEIPGIQLHRPAGPDRRPAHRRPGHQPSRRTGQSAAGVSFQPKSARPSAERRLA